MGKKIRVTAKQNCHSSSTDTQNDTGRILFGRGKMRDPTQSKTNIDCPLTQALTHLKQRHKQERLTRRNKEGDETQRQHKMLC